MMLNGVARGARRDHGRVGLRRAVGGDRDRPRLRRDRRRRRARSSSGSASTTRSARSPCTACPASGARSRRGLFAVPAAREEPRHRHGRARLHAARSTSSACRCSASLAVGAFTFSASFGCLWVMNKLWGIRVERDVETAGLDVSEHGMWGYPEFYIPVPGGYGTESPRPFARSRPPPSRGGGRARGGLAANNSGASIGGRPDDTRRRSRNDGA